MRTCRRHGLVYHYRFKRGRSVRWSCRRCVGEAVTRRKQKIRRILIADAGGRCAICGYDRCVVNMHFHHVDPATKELNMTAEVVRSLEAFRAEARKCVLLCANCHGEVEAGLIESPPPQARYREGGAPLRHT